MEEKGEKKLFLEAESLGKFFPKSLFRVFSFFVSGKGGGQKARGGNRFQAGGVAIDRQISSREAVW